MYMSTARNSAYCCKSQCTFDAMCDLLPCWFQREVGAGY